MENFFFNGEFCHDFEDLIRMCELEDDGAIEALPDDWFEEIELSTPKKVHVFTREDIISLVQEDMLSETQDELDDIDLAIRNCIDFERLNASIPILHYCNRKVEKVTKADLLEYTS